MGIPQMDKDTIIKILKDDLKRQDDKVRSLSSWLDEKNLLLEEHVEEIDRLKGRDKLQVGEIKRLRGLIDCNDPEHIEEVAEAFVAGFKLGRYKLIRDDYDS